MNNSVVMLISLLCLGGSQGRADETLTFGDLSQAGTSIAFVDSPYNRSGFSVSDSSQQFLMWQTGSENYFGSTALIPGFFDSVTTLSQNDHSAFDLLSIDFAKLALGITDSQTLLITGTFDDLSTVTQACSISVAPAFGTCSFGPQFIKVSSVSWGAEALFQYTDIRVRPDVVATPEPHLLGILVLALGVVFLVNVRKSNRAAFLIGTSL